MNRDRKLRRGDEARALELQIAHKRTAHAILFFFGDRIKQMSYLARENQLT